MDALGVKLVNLYPEPNLPGRVVAGGRTVENFGVSRPQTENTHKFDIRSDYYLSQNDRLFVRYSFLQQDIFRGAIFEPPVDDGAEGRGSAVQPQSELGASWTRTFGQATGERAALRLQPHLRHVLARSIGGTTGTEFGFHGHSPRARCHRRPAANRASATTRRWEPDPGGPNISARRHSSSSTW